MSNSLRPNGLQEHQASLSITNSQSLLKLRPISSVMPSNRLTLCHPLLLQPSIFPSIRVFCNESVLRIRSRKYWSFSFSISQILPLFCRSTLVLILRGINKNTSTLLNVSFFIFWLLYKKIRFLQKIFFYMIFPQVLLIAVSLFIAKLLA